MNILTKNEGKVELCYFPVSTSNFGVGEANIRVSDCNIWGRPQMRPASNFGIGDSILWVRLDVDQKNIWLYLWSYYLYFCSQTRCLLKIEFHLICEAQVLQYVPIKWCWLIEINSKKSSNMKIHLWSSHKSFITGATMWITLWFRNLYTNMYV